ncbi:hypothetical protein ES703_116398 [subsurface metagenome]
MSLRRLMHVYCTYSLHGTDMAIVIGPAMSMRASGNVGDMNFTRWRGMSVARTTYVPDYTPSGKQMNQRARMRDISQRWGSWLSPGQRKMWEDEAAEQVVFNRLGGEYKPSGYQYYMKINLMILFIGGVFVYVPPLRPQPVYVWRVRVYADTLKSANAVTMEKEPIMPVDADGFQIYRAGPYDSGGRKPIRPEYRFLTLVWGSYDYYDFGVIDTKWYWYKVRWFFQTGFVGNYWEKQVLTDFPGP